MTALGVSEPDAYGGLLLRTSDSGRGEGAVQRAFRDIHPTPGKLSLLDWSRGRLAADGDAPSSARALQEVDR